MAGDYTTKIDAYRNKVTRNGIAHLANQLVPTLAWRPRLWTCRALPIGCRAKTHPENRARRRELPFAFTSFKRQERRPVILPTLLSCIRELRDELSRLLGILASEVIFVELGVATYPESAQFKRLRTARPVLDL